VLGLLDPRWLQRNRHITPQGAGVVATAPDKLVVGALRRLDCTCSRWEIGPFARTWLHLRWGSRWGRRLLVVTGAHPVPSNKARRGYPGTAVGLRADQQHRARRPGVFAQTWCVVMGGRWWGGAGLIFRWWNGVLIATVGHLPPTQPSSAFDSSLLSACPALSELQQEYNAPRPGLRMSLRLCSPLQSGYVPVPPGGSQLGGSPVLPRYTLPGWASTKL
jgi:hypothetical protein